MDLNSAGLNPYSTGIWSATKESNLYEILCECLNPYSTGIWSATQPFYSTILADYVLILILLEYGLRQTPTLQNQQKYLSLNPYSTGIWSATYMR